MLLFLANRLAYAVISAYGLFCYMQKGRFLGFVYLYMLRIYWWVANSLDPDQDGQSLIQVRYFLIQVEKVVTSFLPRSDSIWGLSTSLRTRDSGLRPSIQASVLHYGQDIQ